MGCVVGPLSILRSLVFQCLDFLAEFPKLLFQCLKVGILTGASGASSHGRAGQWGRQQRNQP